MASHLRRRLFYFQFGIIGRLDSGGRLEACLYPVVMRHDSSANRGTMGA